MYFVFCLQYCYLPIGNILLICIMSSPGNVGWCAASAIELGWLQVVVVAGGGYGCVSGGCCLYVLVLLLVVVVVLGVALVQWVSILVLVVDPLFLVVFFLLLVCHSGIFSLSVHLVVKLFLLVDKDHH